MKTLLDLATQTSASLISFRNSIRRMTATWCRMLLLPLLLLSLLVVSTPAAHAQDAVLTPQQVVEYALTLEKLEADLYRRAIDAFDGGLANLVEPAKNAVRSYGQDEAQHVTDLSAVLTSLGGNPDAITISNNPNYSVILGRDPFANPEDFLLALQNVEDTGVAAYKGQVQNLLAAGPSATTVLAGALEIHTVEARHAAGIRYLRQTYYGADVRPWIRSPKEVSFPKVRRGSVIPFKNEAFDGYATKDEVLAIVGPILAGM
jgi:hypothetical protein